MARVVGIDHLVIRVSDFAKSKRFYDDVLGFLGFKRKYDYADAAGWSNGKTLFWIGEADRKGKRQDVFDLEAFLKKKQITIVDPAAEYYSGGYYAVFFLDPDGLKLEGMHYPTRPRRTKKKR